MWSLVEASRLAEKLSTDTKQFEIHARPDCVRIVGRYRSPDGRATFSHYKDVDWPDEDGRDALATHILDMDYLLDLIHDSLPNTVPTGRKWGWGLERAEDRSRDSAEPQHEGQE